MQLVFQLVLNPPVLENLLSMDTHVLALIDSMLLAILASNVAPTVLFVHLWLTVLKLLMDLQLKQLEALLQLKHALKPLEMKTVLLVSVPYVLDVLMVLLAFWVLALDSELDSEDFS